MSQRRRKRDWFPIVATDFFCGLLGVVVVLDAAAPRAQRSQRLQLVSVSVAAPKVAINCQEILLGFAFPDAQPTTESDISFSPHGDGCVGTSVVRASGGALNARMVVGALPLVDDLTVEISSADGGVKHCSIPGGDCQ